jgi:hypothetical protein
MRWTAFLLPIMLGCAAPPGEVQTPLTQIHRFHIRATKDTFSVVLGDTSGQQSGPCVAALPDLSGLLDGVAVPVVTYGGKVGEDPGDDVSDNECDAPALSVATPPPDHASHLRMSDHSGTIDCELSDLKTMRNAMLVPAGPWDLKSGQPVTVRWSPGSDVGPHGISVELLTFNAAGEIDRLISIDGVVFEGDLITFTLPSVPAGPYELGFGRVAGVTCVPGSAYADLKSDATTFGFGQHITIVP